MFNVCIFKMKRLEWATQADAAAPAASNVLQLLAATIIKYKL